MNPRRIAHRLSTIAFACALVLSMVLGGVGPGSPVGTASAEWSDDCKVTDSILGAAYNTLMGTTDGCRWVAGDTADYENATKTDHYATALGMKDSAESYTTTTGNFMENSRTVAYSKAKITLINELNNGSSVSQAQAAVNDSVESYYSRMQKEIVNDWNSKAMQIHYISTSGNGVFYVRPENIGPNWDSWLNSSATLVNGSSVTGYGFMLRTSSASGSAGWDNPNVWIKAKDPDTGDMTGLFNAKKYTSKFNSASQQATQVKENMDPYVSEVYDQYKAGEINSSDLAMNDPSVIAQEASTSLNSTGYYGHAAIMMSSLGAAGNINASHTIQTGDGTVLNGTLYYTADDVPADGWATNTTYNVTDYNGTFYMAVQKNDGNSTVVDLSNYGSTWTITEATNTKTGEELNATQVHTYTYDSTNASALQEEINRLRQLREQYQNMDAGGSGGGWGIGTEDKAIIALAAIGLILAATRD